MMAERRRDSRESCRLDDPIQEPLEASGLVIRNGGKRHIDAHSNAYNSGYSPKSLAYKTRFGLKPSTLRLAMAVSFLVVGSAVALWSLGLSFKTALLADEPLSSHIGNSGAGAAGERGVMNGSELKHLSSDQLALALSLRQLGNLRRASREGSTDSGSGSARGAGNDGEGREDEEGDSAGTVPDAAVGASVEVESSNDYALPSLASGAAESDAPATTDGEAEEHESVGEQSQQDDANGDDQSAAVPAVPAVSEIPGPVAAAGVAAGVAADQPPVLLGRLPKAGSRRARALRKILQLDVVPTGNTTDRRGRSAGLLVHARPLSSTGPQDGFEALRHWLSKQRKRLLRKESSVTSASRVRLGLVNLNSADMDRAREQFPKAVLRPLAFSAPPADLTWAQLFPEWIDEKNPKECPALPWPRWAGPGNGTVMWPDNTGGAKEWQVGEENEVDALVVRVPCDGLSVFNASWARDVARHHLMLLAASALAAQPHTRDMPVLLLTHCLPPPNIFNCRHLVSALSASWLFAIPPPAMRARLHNAPVGTCRLYPTPPRLPASSSIALPANKQQAWATLLHSSDKYICGALALARSLKRVGTRHELVAFVSKEVSERAQRSLVLAGWKVVAIERMRSSFKASSNYCKWNHSKLKLWQFTQYSKLIFLDTDMLVLRNMDHLFAMPELTAVPNNQFQFNGGLLVVEPSACTFNMLKDALALFETYNDCEQGLLNELYPWWHRLPLSTNFLKFAWSTEPKHLAERRATLAAQPPQVDMVHYLGAKPWYCYRDFDCNWLSKQRQFADDLAFDMWWKVHDEMSEEEQQQCWMPTWTKAALRAAMEKMKQLNEDPRLWNVTISDPRDGKCRDWEETYSCDWRALQSVMDNPMHFRF